MAARAEETTWPGRSKERTSRRVRATWWVRAQPCWRSAPTTIAAGGPRRSAALFSGRIGGPMQALGPHVSENLGVERTPIEVREEGLYHSVEGKAAFSSSHFAWAA